MLCFCTCHIRLYPIFDFSNTSNIQTVMGQISNECACCGTQQTQSKFEEARFKQGWVTQTEQGGKELNPSKLVEIGKIPETAECKEEKNSEKWWGGLPRKVSELPLTFHDVEPNVHTNSIRIDDASMSVHQYTFEVFEVSSGGTKETADETKRVALELSADRKRDIFYSPKVRRTKQLKGLYPCIFDNLHIFSFTNEAPKEAVMEAIEYEEKENKYEILLKRQFSTDPNLECVGTKSADIKKKSGSSSTSRSPKRRKQSSQELYKECSLAFQEMGLNIVNRQRFFNASYTRLHRRDDIYYSLRDMHRAEDWSQRGCDMEYPDLRILAGYKSTITNATHCITKTRTSHKVICKHSVHDFIRRYGVKKFNSFLADMRHKNIKLRAVTNYSHQIVVIDELDDRKNLDSRLDEADPNKGTFREYYSKRKNDLQGGNATVKLLEKQEEALIASHRLDRDGSIKETIYFLPQLLYMIVPKEMQDDAICAELRKRAHPGIQSMVKAALEINERLAKMTKMKRPLFTTEKQVVKVKGYYIDPPMFCFKTRDGIHRIAANVQRHGPEWKKVTGFWRNLSEVYENKKEPKHKENQYIEWAICYNRNGPNRDRYADKLVEMFRQFNDRRNWSKQDEPANKPRVIDLDYDDLHGIRDALKGSKFDVIVFIIPSTEEGGKLKADITRFVLFRDEPKAAFTRSMSSSSSSSKEKKSKRKDGESFNLATDLQFICESTIDSNKAGKFNVFENVFTKSGLILYYLEPKLPSNKFNYKRCWMIGIKVLRKKAAHIVCLSCNRAPFVGTVKYLSNHTVPLESRRDVIPQRVMYQASKQLLEKAIDGILKSKGDEHLPFNIVLLRCSASDGQFKTIISHELAGFRRAFSDFVKEHKKSILQINNEKSSKWYPGIVFSVLQENVTDAFGVEDRNGRLQELDRAMVVNSQITSSQVFDVFLSLPTQQERKRYGRVLRLVTLQDEYNGEHAVDKRAKREDRLRKSAPLMSDYIALIYSSLFAYALNIPYPKTPSIPAPLAYADHYATWQYRTFTPYDTDLDQLKIDCENAKPKLCDIKPERREGGNENDVEMKSQ